MTTVETVRGPIETSALGTTLMHEHVFVLSPEVQQNYPAEWGSEEERVADAVTRLRELKAVGVDTIVDPTVIGLGRYIPRIQRINEQVDINIVAATGLYTYDRLPFFFQHRGPAIDPSAPDPLIGMFVDDIREGIADTGVRAAFLKCAIDEPGLTAGVERALRAVARAHLETGVPITMHTHPGTRTGSVVQRVLGEEGVDPRHVVLGHSGDSDDADSLEEPVRQAGGHRGRAVPTRLRGAHGPVSTTRRATSTGSIRRRCRCCQTGTTRTSTATCCRRYRTQASPTIRSRRCSFTTRGGTSTGRDRRTGHDSRAEQESCRGGRVVASPHQYRGSTTRDLRRRPGRAVPGLDLRRGSRTTGRATARTDQLAESSMSKPRPTCRHVLVPSGKRDGVMCGVGNEVCCETFNASSRARPLAGGALVVPGP